MSHTFIDYNKGRFSKKVHQVIEGEKVCIMPQLEREYKVEYTVYSFKG
jgi:hypothetical protein